MAASRSLIRSLIGGNRVAGRRTRRRPGGGLVAHTVNISGDVSVSFSRISLRTSSILVVYASNLSGCIASSRVVDRISSNECCTFTSQLIGGTGGGKNNSGVAIITVTRWSCWVYLGNYMVVCKGLYKGATKQAL